MKKIILDPELQPLAVVLAAAEQRLVEEATDALRSGMQQKLVYATSSGEADWDTPVASINAPTILGREKSIGILDVALADTAGDSDKVKGRFTAEADPKNSNEVDIYFRPSKDSE